MQWSARARFLLQWSHAQLSVEMRAAGDAIERRYGASMEPRSAERGNLRRAGDRARPIEGFNGATLS